LLESKIGKDYDQKMTHQKNSQPPTNGVSTRSFAPHP